MLKTLGFIVVLLHVTTADCPWDDAWRDTPIPKDMARCAVWSIKDKFNEIYNEQQKKIFNAITEEFKTRFDREFIVNPVQVKDRLEKMTCDGTKHKYVEIEEFEEIKHRYTSYNLANLITNICSLT